MPEIIETGFREDKAIRIVVGRGIADWIGDYVPLENYSAIALLADGGAARLYGERVRRALETSGQRVITIAIPAGEASKSLGRLEKCYRSLAEAGLDRDGLLCVLGGGVAGDLGGFLAATYLRGIDYVQLPTTLLAQVDSSIGGKTGINFGGRKNIIGGFYQPKLVLADTAFLDSLPPREMRNASAELIKYGAAMDEGLFEIIAGREQGSFHRDELPMIIARAARLKAEVVAADETDRLGRRAILNFGHTVGHAVEAVTLLKQMRHGEAVSIGMAAAAIISHNLGMLAAADTERLTAVLTKFGLPARCPGISPDALREAMRADKKVSRRELKWVLLNGIGRGQTGMAVAEYKVSAALAEVCR